MSKIILAFAVILFSGSVVAEESQASILKNQEVALVSQGSKMGGATHVIIPYVQIVGIVPGAGVSYRL